jgi:D-alanine transaminase
MLPLYLNGQFVNLDAPCISAQDRGFQYGDGIYEGVRVYGGNPFRLDMYLARLQRSAAAMELEYPHEQLASACHEVIRKSGLREAILYIQVTRGATAIRSPVWTDEPATVMAYCHPFTTPAAREKGFKGITFPDERWGRCHVKSTAMPLNSLARTKAARAGCHAVVFVRDSVVMETTASSVFIVRGHRILTHPADNRILHGVTRAIVMRELADVMEQRVTLSEALAADEIFLTGTGTQIAGLVELDGRRIGSGEPGPVTKRVAAAYEALWQKECMVT